MTGCGRVVFNSVSTFANGLVVYSPATVAVNPVTLGENGTVAVKVSAADGIRPKGGSYVLTSGGQFAGATVTLASGAPNWVKGVSVVDGEIVLDVKSRGFMLIVK